MSGIGKVAVGRREAEAGLALFALMWGVYTFVHQALLYWRWFHFDGPDMVLGALPMVAAVGLMRRPGSLVWLAATAGSSLVFKLYLLPDVANHVFFTTLVNLMILVGLAWRVLRGDGGAGTLRAAVWADLAPLLRLSLLVLYFYAVLHKLNWDYLNPAVSCGWQLYAQMRDTLAFLPTSDWLRWPAITGSLLIEALIPVLLLMRRTRMYGIVLGVGFHFMLTMHENLQIVSFTLMLYAMYSLFLPSGAALRLRAWARKRGVEAWVVAYRQRLGVAAVGLMVAGLAAVLGYASAAGQLDRAGLIALLHSIGPVAARGLGYGWIAVCMGGLAVLAGLLGRPIWRRAMGESVLALRWTPAAMVLGLIVVNGLSPYVGLKTQSSYAMFSNLRTEAGVNNHLFMPRLQWFEYQDELVRVVEASDAFLAQVAEQGERLPYVELRRRAAGSDDPAFYVRYEHGEANTMVRRSDQPADPLFEPLHPIKARLLHFRAVPGRGQPQTCRH